tara:strand:+ start:3338 stop:4456 length:1119 start_codon:yes stop_codon:yes gene_type:complete
MINNLNKLLIIIILSIFSICEAKDEILFTINNNPTTSIDLNHRAYYLTLLENMDINKVDKNRYIDDLIAVKLFDEFSLKRKVKTNKQKVKDYYDIIFKNNEKEINHLYENNIIKKDQILKNIIYDLQRQKILEFLIDKRIKEIFNDNNEQNVTEIYDIELNYFVLDNIYKKTLKQSYSDLLKKDINSVKEILDNYGILYDFFERKNINLNRINLKLKEIIFSDEKIFFIEEENYFMIGRVDKNMKKNINIKYSFFQIQSNKGTKFEEIINDSIDCNSLKNKKNDEKYLIKEFKSIHLNDLNFSIFKNLSKENQKLIIKNDNQKFMILLCNIDYDKEIVKNRIFQEKVDKLAKEVEFEFVEAKKKEYNFQKLN